MHHQSTPSFKNTKSEENAQVNKAFHFNSKAVDPQPQTASGKSSYQSQTARRGSPPRKGGPSPGMMTKETFTTTSSRNLHQPRSGSTLMAATAASKSRAAEVQMRQGSGTRR